MTDDEIDEELLPMIAKHIKVTQADCRILPFDRIAYRAGMRRAAEIARGEHMRGASHEEGNDYNAAIDDAAAAIERSAGGEG